MYLNNGDQERAKEHLQAAIRYSPNTINVAVDMARYPKRFDLHIMKIIQYHLSAGVFPEESFEFARKIAQLYSDAYPNKFASLALGFLQEDNA